MTILLTRGASSGPIAVPLPSRAHVCGWLRAERRSCRIFARCSVVASGAR